MEKGPKWLKSLATAVARLMHELVWNALLYSAENMPQKRARDTANSLETMACCVAAAAVVLEKKARGPANCIGVSNCPPLPLPQPLRGYCVAVQAGGAPKRLVMPVPNCCTMF